MKTDKYALSIYGDCLEAIGIRNSNGHSIAIIDRRLTPRVGDVVYCLRGCQNVNGYMKIVKRFDAGKTIVGTAYLDPSKDFEFEAAEILGVCVEVYDKLFGNLVWARKDRSGKWI